jgi:hypothetical protein
MRMKWSRCALVTSVWKKEWSFCMAIHVYVMYVAYSISKFYTIYPSLYVGYFCKIVCAKLLRLAFYKKRSTMTFGRGQLEMTYRRGMKSGAWKNFNGENPYEERYGDNWEEELKKAPSMKKYR